MTRLPYALVAAGLLALLVVAVAPPTSMLTDLTGATTDYYRVQLLAVGVCLAAGGVSIEWQRVRE